MAGGWKSALAAPLFEPLAALVARLPSRRFPGLDDLNALAEPFLKSGGGAPIRFVPPRAHASRDFSAQYEVLVFQRGEVQTRAHNWHDLFNALVWLAFPKTKAMLNGHHYRQMKVRRGEKLRGTVRDVLTLFDEGGIIVACADAKLSALLREFRWKELFWERRGEVLESMRFCVFGHAIYEKALEPYKGVTAKALIVEVAPEVIAASPAARLEGLDSRAASYFSRSEVLVSTRYLSPLPILGVPGWEPASASASYYDDEFQFRPGRTRRPAEDRSGG